MENIGTTAEQEALRQVRNVSASITALKEVIETTLSDFVVAIHNQSPPLEMLGQERAVYEAEENYWQAKENAENWIESPGFEKLSSQQRGEFWDTLAEIERLRERTQLHFEFCISITELVSKKMSLDFFWRELQKQKGKFFLGQANESLGKRKTKIMRCKIFHLRKRVQHELKLIKLVDTVFKNNFCESLDASFRIQLSKIWTECTERLSEVDWD